MSAPREQTPLLCTPEPQLLAGGGAPAGVSEAFAGGDAAGVLYLSTTALKENLPPELAWARDWGRLFFTQLCQTRDPGEIGEAPGLLAKLRPYQNRGFAWLYFLSGLGIGACLADDMGLGKTLQLIALLCQKQVEKTAGGKPSILVVPASLVENWLREFSRFAPHLRVVAGHPSVASKEAMEVLSTAPWEILAGCDALLTTYGLLQRAPALQQVEWDLAVLDEAQAIKNPATAQTRSVKKLKAHARIALTGTPVENKMGDLWSLFDFLNPGLLGKASVFAQVAKRLAEKPGGYAPVRKLIRPYLLRRLKTDRRIISDLPDKTEVQARCTLTKKQALLYAKLVEQLKSDLANGELPPNERRGLVLGYLIKFKQVCNHPSHWSGDGRFDPEGKRKIAHTFWGKSWCEHIKSFQDYENRLPRARSYLRQGSVFNLTVEPGKIRAQVAGSTLYDVEISIKPLLREDWLEIQQACAGQVGSLLDLLSGQLGSGLMEVISNKERGLFPNPREIRFNCSCPDYASLCTHSGAVLYGVAVKFDADPALFFQLRGVDPSELLSAGAGQALTPSAEAELDGEDLSALFGIDFGQEPAELPSIPGSPQNTQKPAARKPAGKKPTTRRRAVKKRAVKKPAHKEPVPSRNH